MKIRFPFLKRWFGFVPYIDFSYIVRFEDKFFHTNGEGNIRNKQCRCGHSLKNHKSDHFNSDQICCESCLCHLFFWNGKYVDDNVSTWLVADEDITIVPEYEFVERPDLIQTFRKGTYFQCSINKPHIYLKDEGYGGGYLRIPVDKCHQVEENYHGDDDMCVM